ncbi:hypothetical protein [Bacillus sp. FJAT-27445]|uniref:hypothetical protein n=1 Tax=Bacillus sp. FJAT-27445 TaxID=1679166 RepID=UPI0007441EBA|nr:hypothetical protein [Bacillus sp. FJAT-27445]
MNHDVVEALLILYTKESKVNDIYTLEKIDRTLDELIRKANSTGDPQKLVNNFFGNAGNFLRKRSKYRKFTCENLNILLDYDNSTNYHSHDEDKNMEIDYRNWVKKFIKNKRYCRILLALCDGKNAEDIALLENVSLSQARVLINRAQGKARSFRKESIAI